MRKIANINTHIFKQPDLTWSLISDEAQAMLDVYEAEGVALAGVERSSMITYVDAEVASGNHTLKDYETIYSLDGVNALIDYIGSKTATAVNAPTQDINGYSFDGTTSYINTNFNPSSEGVNYTQNDALVGVFVKVAVMDATTRAIFANNGSPFIALTDNNSGNIVTYINQVNAGIIIPPPSDISSSNLYSLSRINALRDSLFVNGIEKTASVDRASSAPNNSTIKVASFGGSSQFFGGTISSCIIGGSIGLNKIEQNTNLRNLLTSLGTLL